MKLHLDRGWEKRLLSFQDRKKQNTPKFSNGHLSTTPLYFVPTDSPYIYSYLNLSTTATATNACPQLPK